MKGMGEREDWMSDAPDTPFEVPHVDMVQERLLERGSPSSIRITYGQERLDGGKVGQKQGDVISH